MTTVFLDSFDHYTTVAQKWNTALAGLGSLTIVAGSARNGARGMAVLHPTGGNPWGCFAPGTPIKLQYFLGFALKLATAPIGNTCDLALTLDTPAAQGSLGITTARQLVLIRGNVFGGVVVATSVRTLTVGTWYYIEFRHLVDPVAGILEVRVNEEVWATFTGNTQATATTRITGVGFGGNTAVALANQPAYSIDDVYVNDSDGAPPNNTYWGVTTVEAILPTGPGASTGLATLVGAATHWQATNEVPPDEDTSYVADSALGVIDTYAMGNLVTLSAQINAAQMGIRAREEIASAGAFARRYFRGGVSSQGVDTPVGTAYAAYLEMLPLDPLGGDWSVDKVNASECGVVVR